MIFLLNGDFPFSIYCHFFARGYGHELIPLSPRCHCLSLDEDDEVTHNGANGTSGSLRFFVQGTVGRYIEAGDDPRLRNIMNPLIHVVS